MQHSLQQLLNNAVQALNISDFVQAEDLCSEILKFDRNNYAARHILGICALQQGHFQHAVSILTACHRVMPGDANLLSHLATACFQNNQHDLAMQYFEHALKIASDNADVINNYALILKRQGNYQRAIEVLEAHLGSNPASYISYNNLIALHSERLDHNKSIYWLQRSIEIRRAHSIKDVLTIYSDYCMYLLYLPDFDIHKFTGIVAAFNDIQKSMLDITPFKQHVKTNTQLHIAFISGDFRRHPVGFFLESLLRLTPKNIRVTLFTINKSVDTQTDILRGLVDRLVDIADMNFAQAAATIHQHQPDVLIDLSGHTGPNRMHILSYRPAPINISWLGFPCTTGLKDMDYIIGDPVTLPDSLDGLYTETPLRLPQTSICYTPLDNAIEITELPAMRNHYLTFGSFNNPVKLNDMLIERWATILHSCAESRLILKGHRFKNPETLRVVLEKFNRHGIDSQRITIHADLPYKEHLDLYNQIDIALDTIPYNGTTTTCDTLYMGVPVITCQQKGYMVHRYGELLLRQVGLDDLIADNMDDYVSKAVSLAANIEYLDSLRKTLRQTFLKSPVCNSRQFADDFFSAVTAVISRQEL